MSECINKELLADNTCFGCGHENAAGLQIKVARDPYNSERLIGTFNPKDMHTGFPTIVHGGAIFTALDCISLWTPTVLKPEPEAIWITRSAEVIYKKPYAPGGTIYLESEIIEDTDDWKPVLVSSVAKDKSGGTYVKSKFKVLPITPQKFIEISGLNELPKNWGALLNKNAES